MSNPTPAIPSREALLRAAVFVPCTSKEALARWIRTYLDVDLPDAIVDPQSTSSPMDFIWEIYNICRLGGSEEFTRGLAYAARDSFKTLGAAIIEVLMILHLNRDVGHMAAIESQAAKAQEYVRKFLSRPILRDFVVGTNVRKIEITRYVHLDSGKILAPAEWKDLEDPEVKAQYEAHINYITIVIATMQGANSLHVPFLCLDELDLAPPGPVDEARYIPSPGRDGGLPLTLLTSTRKSGFGPVQREIDDAHDTGLQIRHWNIIDVTQACPPERHLPQEPKIPIYVRTDDFSAINKDDWDKLDEKQQSQYQEKEGYTGCLSKCSIFAACQGNLATRQTSKSRLLKPIPHVISLFKSTPPEKSAAQLMCWKPAKTGLIYPNLERDRHMKTAAQMHELITGEEAPAGFGKAELINLFRLRAATFHGGMDFGFTHNWAALVGAVEGNRMFIVECLAIPELELSEKLEVAERRLKHYQATWWPDPAYPSDIKSFRKAGFRMMPFTKEVLEGIDATRMKFWPGMGRPPEVYFLADDEGCEYLFTHLSQYHWKLDAAGKVTDTPDDDDDDAADATRYLIGNVFPLAKTKLKILGQQPTEEEQKPQYDNWMTKKIDELTKGQQGGGSAVTVKKGSFVFDG